MKKHYYCNGGCHGVTEDPKVEVCQMESCSKYHEPLIECNCESMASHSEK